MDENRYQSEFETLYDGGIFLESPRWHDGAFWFSDIGAGTVMCAKAGADLEVVLSDLAGPSGLGWTLDGDLLVACLLDSTVYRVGPDRKKRAFVTPKQHGTLGTNDMVTAGTRSYVTCSGSKFEVGEESASPVNRTGSILLIEHDTGHCRTVACNLMMPNGVAITPDGKTLIVAELYAQRVLTFTIEPDGGLSQPAVLAEFDHPIDGLCLDCEGGVWLGTTCPSSEHLAQIAA